jgi:hypothetical protein
MKIITDPESFMSQQEVFTGEIITRTARRVVDAGLNGESLNEVAGKIAFDIACMLDDVTGIEFEGVEAHPYHRFLLGDDGLIHLGGNST